MREFLASISCVIRNLKSMTHPQKSAVDVNKLYTIYSQFCISNLSQACFLKKNYINLFIVQCHRLNHLASYTLTNSNGFIKCWRPWAWMRISSYFSSFSFVYFRLFICGINFVEYFSMWLNTVLMQLDIWTLQILFVRNVIDDALGLTWNSKGHLLVEHDLLW